MSINSESLAGILDSANEYLQNGRFIEAATICQSALGGQPDNPDISRMLAIIYIEEGNYHARTGRLKNAINDYRRVFALRQEFHSTAQKYIDNTLMEVRRLEGAIADVEQSSRLPSIQITKEDRLNSSLSPQKLNLATYLYQHFGFLLVADLFPKKYIHQLHDYMRSKYARYFEARTYPDALPVGDKRNMITIELEGAFNNPDIYANPLVLPLLERLLGNDLILQSYGAVISLPGAGLQRLHKDTGPLFEDHELNNKLPSHAITLGIPLIEMNGVNGTTRVIPGSHQPHRMGKSVKVFDPVVKPGSCFLFDYRLDHQGTENRSDNIRPLMYNIYSRPWFRDCYNYSRQSRLVIDAANYQKVPSQNRKLIDWAKNEG